MKIKIWTTVPQSEKSQTDISALNNQSEPGFEQRRVNFIRMTEKFDISKETLYIVY